MTIAGTLLAGREKDRSASAACFAVRWLPCVLTFLAFANLCWAIRGPDLGLDGGLSLALGVLPVPATLGFLAHDVHPPLYYVGLRGWLALVGTRPFAVKYLNVAFATLTVAIVASLARRSLGGWSAVQAALLLAVSPIIVAEAANVRDLATGLCFIALNLWAFVETRRRPSATGARLVYLASGVGAIWTTFLTFGVLTGEAIDLLLRRADRRHAVDLVVVAASIVPWLLYIFANGFWQTAVSGGPTTGSLGSFDVLSALGSVVGWLATGDGGARGLLIAAVVLVLVLALAGAIPGASTLPFSYFPIAGLVSTLVFAIVVSTRWLHLGVPARYVGPSLLFWILLVVGLAKRARFWKGQLAVAALAAASLFSTLAWYRQPSLPVAFWSPSVVQAVLDQVASPHDGVIFLTLEQAGYYEALSLEPRTWYGVPVGTGYLDRDPVAQAQRFLPSQRLDSTTLWLVEYHGILGPGQQAVASWLAEHSYPANPLPLNDSQLQPYAAADELGPDQPIGAKFADGVTLTQVRLPRDLNPGRPVPIQLVWHADHPLTRNLTVFVHLVDATGRALVQHDTQPGSGSQPTTTWHGRIVDRHGLFLPDSLGPGPYWIEVGLYDGQGRLAVDGHSDGTIRLGPIRAVGTAR